MRELSADPHAFELDARRVRFNGRKRRTLPSSRQHGARGQKWGSTFMPSMSETAHDFRLPSCRDASSHVWTALIAGVDVFVKRQPLSPSAHVYLPLLTIYNIPKPTYGGEHAGKCRQNPKHTESMCTMRTFLRGLSDLITRRKYACSQAKRNEEGRPSCPCRGAHAKSARNVRPASTGRCQGPGRVEEPLPQGIRTQGRGG